MRLNVLVILLAAFAAGFGPPQRDIPDFQIQDFSAQVYPKALNGTWYSFVEANITLKPNEGQAWCYAWNITRDAKVVAPVAYASCLEDRSIGFSFQGDPKTGYTYSVWWNESSHVRLFGSRLMGSGQFDYRMVGNNTQVAYYNGTNDFPLHVSQEVIPKHDK